jgi:uncharacterized membrane protein YdcZ (DUF606 family)
LAGVGIPLIGVLNSGVARSVGNPFAATAVMFAVAALVAFGLTLPLYGAPTVSQLGSAPPISYGAGLLIGFYGLSATIIIPRLGAASFIAFILIAQLRRCRACEFREPSRAMAATFRRVAGSAALFPFGRWRGGTSFLH